MYIYELDFFGNIVGDATYWSLEVILDEINRDRNEFWLDYNEHDYLEGWDEWVEGEYYTRHAPKQ